MKLTSSTIIVFLVSLISARIEPRNTNPSTSAKIDRGTFENPSKWVRPKFRYWIPDASVDPAVVASDVRTAKDAGMGGLELLGYYLYGGPPSNGAGRGSAAPVDWAKCGFGTEAWRKIFEAFVQAIDDNDMILDFAIGPNQGAGVPAPENSDGLAWDVAAYNVSIPLGGSFDDLLPGWGTGELVAAVTGLVVDSVNVTRDDELAPDPGSLPGDYSLNRTQMTLSASSLADVTDRVSSGGRLTVDFAGRNTSGIGYTIFAIYQFRSDYRAQDGPLDLGGPQSVPMTPRQNGSWAVDHFSARGAKTTSDYWEQYLLAKSTLDVLNRVGTYAWEDSVEIEANVYWTPDFLAYFRDHHGYSLSRWLPVLFHRNGHYLNSNPDQWWITDEPDGGNSHIADYRATLADRYQAYLTTLNEWTAEYLGMEFSAQISYNLPMDMLENIPYADAPECESLDFSDLIDGYRQYAGPANLAERRIVSSECGAVRGEGFVQTIPELLWHAKRSWAGAINQFVFHGFPYSGDYGNTTWPVFSTFNYQYSDMHGAHRPDFFQYREAMDFVARNNWVAQAGTPKIDVAFWQKTTVYPGHIQLRTYEPTDLEEMGYTYEYLSPDNFDLPSAVVTNRVLAPDAQSFKAMVVRANDSLTIQGVERLVAWAHRGLPIILAGGIPELYVGTHNAMEMRKSQRSLRDAASLPNVHVTDSYFVASTLQSISVLPRTRIKAASPSNAKWYTNWRNDGENDYIYIYNDAIDFPQGQGGSEATIEFQSTGMPYEYDAWTGAQTPIACEASSNTTTLALRLAGNQSTIIAFHGAEHVSNHNRKSGHHGTRRHGTGHDRLQTCNPSNESYNADIAASITLRNWTLIAEHWDPPKDLYNITGGAHKHDTTHHLPHLVSWQDIDGLQNVSGRGYYSASFDWAPSPSFSKEANSAILDFGWVYDTLQASLNGHRLPPLDVTNPKINVKHWLVEGPNTLEAVVGTPLGNAMIPIWYQLYTSGEGPASDDASTVPPPVGQYGLQTDVTVTWFE